MMSTLLSDAAAAMSKAAHAKLTPEARSERASKLARARWKGNGLTRDQKRVLAKLARSEVAKISMPGNAGGVRVARAVQALADRGVVTDVVWGWRFARYSRGPGWSADLVK